MLTGLIDCNKTYVLPLENATKISSFSVYTLLCLNYKISSGNECLTNAGMASCSNSSFSYFPS